jgi:excisionase family DNA binding protein
MWSTKVDARQSAGPGPGAVKDAHRIPAGSGTGHPMRTRDPQDPQDQLQSLTSAAAYAGVSTRTLRRWIAAGTLPGYKIGPKLTKVYRGDLEKLVRRIPTGGEAA